MLLSYNNGKPSSVHNGLEANSLQDIMVSEEEKEEETATVTLPLDSQELSEYHLGNEQ
jgi:hypothetical protein